MINGFNHHPKNLGDLINYYFYHFILFFDFLDFKNTKFHLFNYLINFNSYTFFSIFDDLLYILDIVLYNHLIIISR